MGLPTALRPFFLDLLACLSASSPIYRCAAAKLLADEIQRNGPSRGRKYADNFTTVLAGQGPFELAGTDEKTASHFFKYALSNFLPGVSSPMPPTTPLLAYPGATGVKDTVRAFMGATAFDAIRQDWEDALDARDSAERLAAIVGIYGTAAPGQPYPTMILRAERFPLSIVAGVIMQAAGTYDIQHRGITRDVLTDTWSSVDADFDDMVTAGGAFSVINGNIGDTEAAFSVRIYET